MKKKIFFSVLLSSLVFTTNINTYAKENHTNYVNSETRTARSSNSVFYYNAYRRGNNLIVEMEVQGPRVIRHQLKVNGKEGRQIGKRNTRNGVIYTYEIKDKPYGFHDLEYTIITKDSVKESYKFYLLQKI